MPEPSYVVGSSFSLDNLSDEERAHLDNAKWVFVCNSFPSHWKDIGFRPTVWAYGDNDRPDLIKEVREQLQYIKRDDELRGHLRHMLACEETHGDELRHEIREADLPVQVYHRWEPWRPNQQPAATLLGKLFHYGSTLTDLVNLAWILNPGQPIRIIGNEYGPGFGHFWEPPKIITNEEGRAFWLKVQRAMWQGIAHLAREHHMVIVDCNPEHEEELPEQWRLPRQPLIV